MEWMKCVNIVPPPISVKCSIELHLLNLLITPNNTIHLPYNYVQSGDGVEEYTVHNLIK